MKAALRLLVLLVLLCRVANAEEAAEAEQRFATAARSIVAKLVAGFNSIGAPAEGVSREELMKKHREEMAADLEIVQGATEAYPSERARLLAMVNFVTGPEPQMEDFKKFFADSFQVKLTENPSVSELAKEIGDALQGISLGLDMEERKEKTIGELFARFGPPTTLGKPDEFQAKFNGMERAVVVLRYDLARKNIYVDRDGAVITVNDMKKSLPSKQPATK